MGVSPKAYIEFVIDALWGSRKLEPKFTVENNYVLPEASHCKTVSTH